MEPEPINTERLPDESKPATGSPSAKPDISNDKKWRVESIVSVIALIVSIGALAVAALSLWHDISPGEVTPLKPSGYAIIRGFDPFPSDHLVLPLEWQNSSGKSVLVRHPYLVLRKLDSNDKETGTSYRFTMEGEFSEISTRAFSDSHVMARSFALDPRSLSLKVLIFHLEKWWDDTDSLYDFRFKAGESYRVYIGFETNLTEQPETALFDLDIYGYADQLVFRGEGNWWDFWTLED